MHTGMEISEHTSMSSFLPEAYMQRIYFEIVRTEGIPKHAASLHSIGHSSSHFSFSDSVSQYFIPKYTTVDLHPGCTGYECSGKENYCWVWLHGNCNKTDIDALSSRYDGLTTCVVNDDKHKLAPTATSLFDPKVGPPLSGKDYNSNSHNLQACTNECDDDGQCAPGLLCFQRSNLEHVWGCSGQGKSSWDYCYDPWFSTEIFYVKITTGTCADHGFTVVNTVQECDFAARNIGMYDWSASSTGDSTVPEGCYAYGSNLYLGTNKANVGRGATPKCDPICRVGPGSVKFERLSAPSSKLSLSGRFHDPSASSVLQLTMKPSSLVDETAVTKILDSSPWTCADPDFEHHVLEHPDGSMQFSRALVDRVRYFQGYLYNRQTLAAEHGVCARVCGDCVSVFVCGVCVSVCVVFVCLSVC